MLSRVYLFFFWFQILSIIPAVAIPSGRALHSLANIIMSHLTVINRFRLNHDYAYDNDDVTQQTVKRETS